MSIAKKVASEAMNESTACCTDPSGQRVFTLACVGSRVPPTTACGAPLTSPGRNGRPIRTGAAPPPSKITNSRRRMPDMANSSPVGPPYQAYHRANGRSLGQALNCSESIAAGRDPLHPASSAILSLVRKGSPICRLGAGMWRKRRSRSAKPSFKRRPRCPGACARRRGYVQGARARQRARCTDRNIGRR